MARLMTLEEAQRDRGRQEGLQEGRQKAKLEIAGNMIRYGVDDDYIAKWTGLSIESVTNLRRELNGT